VSRKAELPTANRVAHPRSSFNWTQRQTRFTEGAVVLSIEVSPWLTTVEAAEYLRLAHSTLKKRVAANQVPHRHVGRRVVLRRDELDRWMDDKPGLRA
jgi:excisionase family DNA binding protein